MKYFCLHIILVIATVVPTKAQSYELLSPDGNLKFSLEIGDSMIYSVFSGSKRLIKPSPMGMVLNNGYQIGSNAHVNNSEQSEVHGIISVLNGKNKEITEDYRELILEMDSFALIVRAYDEGIAYRFRTGFSGEIIIKNETAEFNFEGIRISGLVKRNPK